MNPVNQLLGLRITVFGTAIGLFAPCAVAAECAGKLNAWAAVRTVDLARRTSPVIANHEPHQLPVIVYPHQAFDWNPAYQPGFSAFHSSRFRRTNAHIGYSHAHFQPSFGLGYACGLSCRPDSLGPAYVYGRSPQIIAPDPNLRPHPPVAEVEVIVDPVRAALGAGAYAKSVKLLEQAVGASPDDARIKRLLAIAKVGVGAIDEAQRLIGEVYAVAPELAGDPLPRDIVGSSDRLRTLLIRSVLRAHRTRSADGWLLVATIGQAEGRPAFVAKMSDRAIALGLDTTLAPDLIQGSRVMSY